MGKVQLSEKRRHVLIEFNNCLSSQLMFLANLTISIGSITALAANWNIAEYPCKPWFANAFVSSKKK